MCLIELHKFLIQKKLYWNKIGLPEKGSISTAEFRFHPISNGIPEEFNNRNGLMKALFQEDSFTLWFILRGLFLQPNGNPTPKCL